VRLLLTPFICIVLVVGISQAANDPPDWVREAAARKTPEYSAKVGSVIILSEEAVSVDPDGRRVMRERGVVKILQPGETGTAMRSYNSKNGRIRDFQGWLIPPSGKPVAYGKERVVDVANKEGVYEELRMKVIDTGNVAPGSVFAWEVTEEEKTVFTQYQFAFQQRTPVLLSRFSLTMPPGWELASSMLNHDQMPPKTAGNTSTWELRDLPWIEDEDYGPSISTLAPQIVVSYFPSTPNTALRGLKDWTDVSTWLAGLVDPPAEPTDTVRTKAAQLTANAAAEIDKIRAIAAFVQQTKYVAISLNLTRGGGYTPRKSDDVLSSNYGDCKDKVTLMRALLKAVGIESYLTTIAADDRTYVRAEWASPMQFDHAVVAIRVSGDAAPATVVESPNLGKLLMFDPTDSITPVGDFPLDEQGGYALIVAGSKGSLLRMPVLPVTSNRVESVIDGELEAGGHIKAKIQRQYFGQSGITLQAVERFEGAAELRKRFERAYSRRLPGAAISGLNSAAQPQKNVLTVGLEIAADRFGQSMQGNLFVVRPGLLASGGQYSFTSKQRSAPIKLESSLNSDTIHIKLPAGFKLDELPAPAKIESPYGLLQSSWTVQNGELVMQETMEIRDTLAPASSYAKVREFFELVAGAQAAPVVLIKQ
jgi:hypothetical protein